jgi:hypothetical protein
MPAASEEPEADRSEPADATREPPPRRKPPVTIDLAANSTSDAAPGAPEPAPADIAEAASEVPDDETRDSPAEPDDRAGNTPAAIWNLDGANLVPLAAAALAGAVVAVAVGIALQSAGIVPSPAGRDARTALAQANRLEGDISTLSASMRGAITEQQAISARLAGLETIARDLITTTEQLRSLDSLTAATEARLDQLEQSVAALKNGGSGAPASDERIAALSSEVERLSARLAELTEAPPTDQRTAAAARGMAFASLRAAAERGEPFREELALLRLLGVDAATLAELDGAKDGVPSKAALATSFAAVADAIVAAGIATPADASVLERIWDQARSLVSIRPVGPIEGTTPEAIVSRMRASVKAGDLSAALAERGALPLASKSAFAAWARDAEARIALDRALIGLERAIETAAATQ